MALYPNLMASIIECHRFGRGSNGVLPQKVNLHARYGLCDILYPP